MPKADTSVVVAARVRFIRYQISIVPEASVRSSGLIFACKQAAVWSTWTVFVLHLRELALSISISSQAHISGPFSPQSRKPSASPVIFPDREASLCAD